MPTSNITSRLMSALPESIWAEANRRLRLVPELWKLAEDDQVLKALCEMGGDEARWQPGSMALTAYAAKHPECSAVGAEAWFLGDGKERLGTAYAQLISTVASAPLHPLDGALPAALALRLRMRATLDWAALAQEATLQPDRWRLPLQYLWGLAGSVDPLFIALLKAGPHGANLAGLCLVVNQSSCQAAELAHRVNGAAPMSAWPELARAIEGLGEADYARMVIRTVAAVHTTLQTVCKKSVEGQAALSDEVDAALLLAASEDHDLANGALTRAWTHTRQLGAVLAGHIARLALGANDPVAALGGYQAALSEQPDSAELRTGLARTLSALNRPGEALATLKDAGDPASLVVAARAQLDQGNHAEAQATLQPLVQQPTENPSDELPAALLAEAAHLCYELGLHADAIALMGRAAQASRTNAGYYHTVALWLNEQRRWSEARETATEAAALAPHSAAIRETLGHALLQTGQPAEAVPHFQSAVAFEPARWSASLGLARAALSIGQPTLAHDAARQALAQPLEPGLEGEAHVVVGQALSELKQDEQAFEHFHRASVLTPAAPEPWRAMAQHHLRRGETVQALAILEAGRQALTLSGSPHLAPLLADLADVYQTTGRDSEAIVALREVCAADADAANAHRKLGMLLRQQGYTADAISVLQRALQLLPGDGQAAHELGQAFEKNGQLEEAWAAYQQAVLARPADVEPYLNLGRLTLVQCRRKVKNASPFQAVAALTEAAARSPENDPQAAEAFGLLAQAQQLAGNLDSASESYQKALQIDPKRTEWALGLGEISVEVGKPQIAIAALQEALAHAAQSQTPAIHQALARAYAQSGLWPEARHNAEMALTFTPESPALLALLAEASSHLDQPERAADYWRQAVDLNPRDAQMQIKLARGLMAAGKADEARAVFGQALALAPDSAPVRLAAGDALMELGEIDQAFQVLSEAADLAPRSADTQAALGRVAARAGKYETAQAAFLRAAELTENQVRAGHLGQAGEALWSMGRTAAAVALWQIAVTLNPKDAGLLARQGIALVKVGQYPDALAALEKAIEIDPSGAEAAPETMRETARAALAVGQLDKAAAHLERVILKHAGDAEARFLLGKVREQQGDADQALSHYRQAARMSPGQGQYLAASAETLAKQGKLAEALKQIEAAVKVSADDPEVQQRAGEIYLQAGRAGEAARAFQQLVVARPRSPQAHVALAHALVVAAETAEHETRAGLKPAVYTSKSSLPFDQPLPEILPVIEQAAALGADAQTVRYWMGRAKAVSGNPHEACQLLESVANSKAAGNGTRSELFRSLGLALRKAGQPQRALETLQAVVKQNPETPTADIGQAALHLEMGLTCAALADTQGALSAFKRAVAAAPEWPVAHAHLAEALLALNEIPEAIQVLQRAINLKPDAAAWHYRLAKVYQAQHDPATALAHFQRAQELDPGNASYAADLAQTLAHDGDLAAAAELYRRATDIAPDNDQLWSARGQTHLALKDLKAAAACYNRAAQLAPANVAALLGGARVSLAQGDLHDAANKAEAAARLAGEDSELHVEALVCLAEIQMARGENGAAEASFAAAAAKTRQPAAALMALGRLYFSDGKLDQSIDALERAVAALPDNDEGRSNADLIFATLGTAYETAGRPDDALSAYREAVRISPRSYKHLWRLGHLCREQGQLDQALDHLLQARDIKPNSDEVLREAGLVYEQRKEYDRALEMHQQAIQAAPALSENYTRAGIVLKQLKAYPEAADALERAVALDSHNVEATKQLAVVSALNLMYGKQRTHA